MVDVSIESTLELWASSLQNVKSHIRRDYTFAFNVAGGLAPSDIP
jgi:hypothetical protein